MASKAVSVLVATTVIIGGGVALTAGGAAADEGTVERVIDGDTLKVRVEGRVETVRLLNVDAPETKHPNKDVECLGPEAADGLKALLPVGSSVTLEYDEERTDRYGRTLAGVFHEDGTLINAEVARLGLGAAAVYGTNDRFLPAVQSAQADAAEAERGLHSDDVACTVAGQVAALGHVVAAAEVPIQHLSAMSSAELGPVVANAAAAVVAASALAEAFRVDRSGAVWAALSSPRMDSLTATARRHRASARKVEVRSAAAHQRAVAREAQAVRAAAEAEAARLAKEAAAAERARVAAVDAKRRAKAAATPPRVSRPATKAPVSSNPYPGYTGPRCYAPGGKTWKPC